MTDLAAAREALRLRQGSSARYDAQEAPSEDLAKARLASAFFARKLNELSDEDFSSLSQNDKWTKAHVICDVSYHARALCRQIEAASAGMSMPRMYNSLAEREEELELGATLPPHALRNLYDHSSIHLNVVWRDLLSAGWDQLATNESSEIRSLRQTPAERATLLWASAIRLSNGTRQHDVPAEFRQSI